MTAYAHFSGIIEAIRNIRISFEEIEENDEEDLNWSAWVVIEFDVKIILFFTMSRSFNPDNHKCSVGLGMLINGAYHHVEQN